MQRKFVLLKKENIWLACLVLLLVAAGITNFALKNRAEPTDADIDGEEPGGIVMVDGQTADPETAETDADANTNTEGTVTDAVTGNDSYFVEYRFNRDDTRNQEIALLQSITDDEDASEASKEEARQKIAEISRNLRMVTPRLFLAL